MANQTTNYGLTKPLINENYNVADQNGNMDIIDTKLKENADATAGKETPSGAQAKADEVQSNLGTHLAETTNAHGGIVSQTNFSTHIEGTVNDGVHGLATTADITYYVATTGDDNNDGLKNASPFRTIQHAIDSLPQIINHTININVEQGTYNETVSIKGFSGKGTLNLSGGTSQATALNYITNSFNIYDTTIKTTIEGFKAISTSIRFRVVNTSYVKFNYCIAEGATNLVNFNVSDNSFVYLVGCVSSDSTSSNGSIYSAIGSVIFSSTVNGTGNSKVFTASAGIIYRYGTTPTGTTLETKVNGGQIFS